MYIVRVWRWVRESTKVPFIRKNPEDASTLPGLGFKVLLEKSVAKYNKHWKGDAHHSSVGHDLLF